MKKRIFICILFFLLLIFFAFFILKNSSISLENLNFKTYGTKIENKEMVILKDRHIIHNKIYGRDYYAPCGTYIYYNPDFLNPKYVICTYYQTFTTNNEKLFWEKFNENILLKVSSQEVYIVNLCSAKNNNKFLEKLRKQNYFEELAVDFYSEEGHENDIGYFNYLKYGSFVTFELYDLCICGSDGWIEFTDENKFVNKCKVLTGWFYY